MTAPTFDPETHTYTKDGRRYESVTQVIRDVLPGWQASEWHMQRGKAMHRGCELLLTYKLDWGTVAPEIRGRLQACKLFMEEARATCVSLEKAVWSDRVHVAGTLDAILRIDGERVLIDWKGGAEYQAVIQVGAYASMLPKQLACSSAVVVELRDDGSYRCDWVDRHRLRRAAGVFAACVTVFNAKRAGRVE